MLSLISMSETNERISLIISDNLTRIAHLMTDSLSTATTSSIDYSIHNNSGRRHKTPSWNGTHPKLLLRGKTQEPTAAIKSGLQRAIYSGCLFINTLSSMVANLGKGLFWLEWSGTGRVCWTEVDPGEGPWKVLFSGQKLKKNTYIRAWTDFEEVIKNQ